MKNKPKILVVGSFVMDLIVSTDRFPNSGETVFGTSFSTAPGGKGANQAMQAARLGAKVTMVGKVGDDAFGKELLDSCKEADIDISYTTTTNKVASAIGNILLEKIEHKKTANRIIVVPGANMELKYEDIACFEDKIKEYDIVIMQLEIPMEINMAIATFATKHNVPIMLNSAPYSKIPNELLKLLTFIAPNEHEAYEMTGIKIQNENNKIHMDSLDKCMDEILKLGVKNAIITLGDKGAYFANETTRYLSKSVKNLDVKDPTAAGDSFVGAFCTAICAGIKNEDALDFANYTAALTVCRMGAQPSLPLLVEVINLIKQHDSSKLNALGIENSIKE